MADFFVAGPEPGSRAPVAPVPPDTRRWPVALVMLALVGVIAASLWWLWPQPSGHREDTSTAALFGRETGRILPAPITAAECTGAMGRFPGITGVHERAAFVDACVGAHGPTGPSDPALTG